MNELFKIVSMGRTGTAAMTNFLDCHPELSVPKYQFVQKACEQMETKDNKFPIKSLKFDKSPNVRKHGLVIHHTGLFSKTYAQKRRLSALKRIKANALFLLVRNPVEQVVSWINFINQCVEIGDYLGWTKKVNNLSELLNHKPTLLDGLKLGQQCEIFYKNTSDIKLIDFESLKENAVHQTMQECYAFLNVDESFTSSQFVRPQNSALRSLFHVGVTMKLKGEEIFFRFVPESIMQQRKENGNPLPYFAHLTDVDEVFKKAPSMLPEKGDLYLVPKSVVAFNSIPQATRKYIFDNVTNIVSELVFKWAEHVEKVIQQGKKNQIKSLSNDESNSLHDLLKDDLEVFYNYHPEYRNHWSF